MSGGYNLFELIYERHIPLTFSLRRILEECIVYDSEVEADYMDKDSDTIKSDKYSIRSKLGIREIKFNMWLEAEHPDYIAVEFTLLTTEEFKEIVKSADYYRNLFEAS